MLLDVDRAFVRWLRGHHLPADLVYGLVGAVTLGAVLNTLPRFHAFWVVGARASCVAVAAVALCALSLHAGRSARRDPHRVLAVLARVIAGSAVSTALVLPLIAG